jgi:parallel beta-helix repeat protein
LSAGTYGKLNLSGTHSSNVTIQPAPSTEVTLGGVSIANNSNNFTIYNFYITNEIDFGSGVSNLTIDHNDITGGYFGVNGGGVDCSVPHSPTYSGCTPTPKVTNIRVTGNKLHDFGASQEDALHFNNFDGIYVAYNEITGVVEGGNHNDCLQTVFGGSNITFDHNYEHDNNCQGFFIKDGDVTNATVTNNLFVRNRVKSLDESTVQVFDTYNYVFRNNTNWSDNGNIVRADGSSNTYGVTVDHNVTQSFNNGCPNPSTCSPDGYPFSSLTENYNIYKSNPSTFTKSATSQVVASPTFVDPAHDDYRLATNPNNIGVNWKPSDYTYGPVTTSCTSTVASTANLSSVVASAIAGSVVCLSSSADYGKLDLSNVSKSSDVTIMPVPGVTPSLWLWLGGTNHVKIQGLTIAGGYVNKVHNVTLMQNKFTDNLRVDGDPAGNMNLLIDGNTFDNINWNGGYDGRLSILGGGSSTTPVGITVSNNHFGGGGNTDGVFLSGEVNGAQIGPGNEFEDIHNVAGSHTDAIQLYGTSRTTITGNYLHNNDSGIMAPDGSSSETITNNVVITDGYACPLALGGAINNTVTHNTLTQGSVCVSLANGCGARSSGNIVRDNIANVSEVTGWDSNGVPCPGSTTGFISAQDHNLSSNSSWYVGPLSPTDGSRPVMSAYTLKSATPGKSAASDGTDIGVNISSSPAGTPTPKTGDLNADSQVNIFDLSILLSNYGKTKAQASNPACDLNNDSTINIFDLSILLSNYGK